MLVMVSGWGARTKQLVRWLHSLAGPPPLPLPEVGSYYAVPAAVGGFQIVKVLVTDPDVVHLRLYSKLYKKLPEKLNLKKLTLGGIDDEAGFGLGHMPLSLATFQAWQPQFVQPGTVAPAELEGYELWEKKGGGVF